MIEAHHIEILGIALPLLGAAAAATAGLYGGASELPRHHQFFLGMAFGLPLADGIISACAYASGLAG